MWLTYLDIDGLEEVEVTKNISKTWNPTWKVQYGNSCFLTISNTSLITLRSKFKNFWLGMVVLKHYLILYIYYINFLNIVFHLLRSFFVNTFACFEEFILHVCISLIVLVIVVYVVWSLSICLFYLSSCFIYFWFENHQLVFENGTRLHSTQVPMTSVLLRKKTDMITIRT